MVAVNLAVALQRRGWHTALFDGSLSNGTVDTFLGLGPSNAILHLIHREPVINAFTVQKALIRHSSGLHVLLAPREAEQGETITEEALRLIVGYLQTTNDVVVADTSTGYDERMLLLLDLADRIVVPLAPDLAAIKSVASFLRVSSLMGHPPEKLILVLVRANTVPRGQVREIEQFLGRPLDHHIPSDGPAAMSALNEGTPVVLRHPQTALAAGLLELASIVEAAVIGS
jgi:pilus assembly protein CpaE